MGVADRYADEFNSSAMGKYAAHRADNDNENIKAFSCPDSFPLIVALTGVAGSGKSTASAFLQSKGRKLVKFADPLKNMLRVIGMTEDFIDGELKEGNWYYGKTARYAMQTLGTSWGRECMGEDFWVDIWKDSVIGTQYPIVTDDCRYANEATAVRSMGGIVIKLEGRGGIAGSHDSEKLDFIADAVVPNTGSIAQLHAILDDVLSGWAA